MPKKGAGVTRRSFLKLSAGVAAASGLGLPRTAAAKEPSGYAVMIDLSLCDGCPQLEQPACVKACRDKNLGNIPDPVDPMPELFPRGKIEDWSDKKAVDDRLTPYNWIYVQQAAVEHGGKKYLLSLPRRCMHCDNPACATICPFHANIKNADGSVVIDEDICFGGAKCRTVCPWAIPQRQSGVGVYLDIAPTYAGNGVMFKCDLCHDLLQQGQEPACITACPRQAMLIGDREVIIAAAERRAAEIGGHIYGLDENGGTATLYVSPVPFEKIDAAIKKGPGRPHLKKVERAMAATDGLGLGVLAAPAAGIAAGVLAALLKPADEQEGPEDE